MDNDYTGSVSLHFILRKSRTNVCELTFFGIGTSSIFHFLTENIKDIFLNKNNYILLNTEFLQIFI